MGIYHSSSSTTQHSHEEKKLVDKSQNCFRIRIGGKLLDRMTLCEQKPCACVSASRPPASKTIKIIGRSKRSGFLLQKDLDTRRVGPSHLEKPSALCTPPDVGEPSPLEHEGRSQKT